MALRASFSPDSRVSVSSLSINSRREPISRCKSASTLSPSLARSRYAEMSSLRRARSASVARTCSSRFFSRITCWDFCGFDHKFGSEACFSISANCGRTFSASKILPEFAHFLVKLLVFLFEFLIHEDASAFVRDRKRISSAPIEIIAHTYANQSPWRL